MSCTIRVRMLDDQEYSATTEIPRGDYVSSPLTKDEIVDKFKSSVAFSRAITLEKTNRAIDLLERLEKLNDLNDLIATVTPG